MSYTALYRKFRPAGFGDVKGQDHIVTTLKNQIKADRIGHAYLFCGTRGTGKTTIAKIFAKTVNCKQPADGSPCNECEICRAIQAGTSMNVIEIDAASNNGVDNIREIREEVAYSPTEGKYKVYIIDEVHMLSIGAFNALLKTLEEPPAYVIFILATTEAHKIPVTILSRCQRYDFRRISIETIAVRLRELMEKEQIEAEEKAIRYVAKAADGSMRDALSLLDQCIAFYLGQKLTYEHVLEVLGAVDTEVFSALLRKILAQDITGGISLLEELVMSGCELSQFVNDFTWYLRNLLLVKADDRMEDILDVSAENLLKLKEESGLVGEETLMRFIRIFSDLSGQLKYAAQKRILIEIALIKLCKPVMEQDLSSVLQRLDMLEERVESGAGVLLQPPQKEPEEEIQKEEIPAPAEEALSGGKLEAEDRDKILSGWGGIVASAENQQQAALHSAKRAFDEQGRLVLTIDQKCFLARAVLKEKDIAALIQRKTGAAVEVKLDIKQDKAEEKAGIEDYEKKIKMPVEFEQ